jgi:hypothetical protein
VKDLKFHAEQSTTNECIDPLTKQQIVAVNFMDSQN